ncbi:predicted protein [Enterococcus casseliflavus EC10]|nr:predicted protein [Enterococcus casseliflavus EC10]
MKITNDTISHLAMQLVLQLLLTGRVCPKQLHLRKINGHLKVFFSRKSEFK